MRIKGPEFIICPLFQGSVKLGVKPQQNFLFLHLLNHLISKKALTSIYPAIMIKITMFTQNILGASALLSQPFPLTREPCLTQQNPANKSRSAAIVMFTIFTVSTGSPTIRLEVAGQSLAVTCGWLWIVLLFVEQPACYPQEACTSFSVGYRLSSSEP